jgi:hypothetical protein
MRPLTAPGGLARPPIMVLVLAAAFLLLVAAILIGSLTRPEFPPYDLTVARPSPVGDTLVGPAVYTLDASSTDAWRRFSFSENSAVDTGPWDLAFRRFHVITAEGGGIEDLGVVPFDSVAELPEGGYVPNDTQRDTTNPGVGKWYDYSMLSHLLTSKEHIYGVRTRSGTYAKFEMLAYYCKQAGIACVTFRYAYQGNGSRRVK